MEEKSTEKRGKLKSRKFWISIVVIAVAVIYGVRAMGIEDNEIISCVCIACACIAGICYVIAEAMVDSADALDDAVEAEIEEEEEQG